MIDYEGEAVGKKEQKKRKEKKMIDYEREAVGKKRGTCGCVQGG